MLVSFLLETQLLLSSLGTLLDALASLVLALLDSFASSLVSLSLSCVNYFVGSVLSGLLQSNTTRKYTK